MRRNPVLNYLCRYSVTGAPITLLRNGNRHCSGEEKPVMLSKTPAFSCIIASFLLLGYPAARADPKTGARRRSHPSRHARRTLSGAPGVQLWVSCSWPPHQA
jgi:hypothetical protein